MDLIQEHIHPRITRIFTNNSQTGFTGFTRQTKRILHIL
jgi:hypothetical protein